jgi:DNA mismatch repair ATPase MutS
MFGRLFVDAVKDDTRQFFSRKRRRLAPFDTVKDDDREMDRIAILHSLLDRPASDVLDPATWDDLDMDRVYSTVDRCVSPMGEQTLYDVLRTTSHTPDQLAERDRLARYLADHADARETIRSALSRLATRDAYYLPNLFLAALPDRPRLYAAFPMLTALAVAFLALLVRHPQIGLAGLVAVIATNIVIQYRYHSRITPIVRPLTLVSSLLRAADAIEDIEADELTSHTNRIRNATVRLKPIKGLAYYLSFERSWDDMMGGLYTYLNTVFLLDVNAFAFSLETLRANRESIRELYNALGELDAAVSIAGYRRSVPQWSVPNLKGEGRFMEVRELRHPLLRDAVANDLDIHGRSILITGSNMAGKTTFIRAIAINAVLAQTIYTTTSKSYTAPRLNVRTMIGRADDLSKGQSYFAAELDMSLALVNAAASQQQHLFAIDEIFRGTNTIERVAAARAVLAALAASNHIVLAATHDLELLHLLDEHWEFYHFRETVTDGTLQFDYRILHVPSSTHNAIRMIEVYGFPEGVVKDARRVAEELTRRNADWQSK